MAASSSAAATGEVTRSPAFWSQAAPRMLAALLAYGLALSASAARGLRIAQRASLVPVPPRAPAAPRAPPAPPGRVACPAARTVRPAGSAAGVLPPPGITLQSGKIYTVSARGLVSGTGARGLGAQIIVNN